MIQPEFKSELLTAVEKLVEDVDDFEYRYSTVAFFLLSNVIPAVSSPAPYSVLLCCAFVCVCVCVYVKLV